MSDKEADGEIATNEEWRGVMKRARIAHKLSQEALGKHVGLSQAMINKIENGDSGGSSSILAICRVLSIPAPMNFADEREKLWHDLGHAARRLMAPEQYEAHLRLFETTVRQLEAAQPPADEPAPGRRK